MRLTNDHFIALRSLAQCKWRQDDVLYWKVSGRWVAVYPDSLSIYARFRVTAYELIDDLVERGLAERSNRTCCEHHRHELEWRITPKGMAMIQPSANRAPGIEKVAPRRRGRFARFLAYIKWRLKPYLPFMISRKN